MRGLRREPHGERSGEGAGVKLATIALLALVNVLFCVVVASAVSVGAWGLCGLVVLCWLPAFYTASLLLRK